MCWDPAMEKTQRDLLNLHLSMAEKCVQDKGNIRNIQPESNVKPLVVAFDSQSKAENKSEDEGIINGLWFKRMQLPTDRRLRHHQSSCLLILPLILLWNATANRCKNESVFG